MHPDRTCQLVIPLVGLVIARLIEMGVPVESAAAAATLTALAVLEWFRRGGGGHRGTATLA